MKHAAYTNSNRSGLANINDNISHMVKILIFTDIKNNWKNTFDVINSKNNQKIIAPVASAI